MDTLVAAHHRNHHHNYNGRNRRHDTTRFDSFGSVPLGKFTGVNCRTFQSGVGLLPTPSKFLSTVVTKNAFSASLLPKTPCPSFNENRKGQNRNVKSSSGAILIRSNVENKGKFHFSERWAGPAYSYSPPPSSLPLPRFSMRPKRTVSLDLPTLVSDIDLRPIAKSAPASPTRDRSPSPRNPFDPLSPRNMFELPSPGDLFERPSSSDKFDRVDAAKTLCRILNLDLTD